MDELQVHDAFDEARLILADKRTQLATLRTGIAVFALPLTLTSLLIAFSKYYQIEKVLGMLVPVLIACIGLAALGLFLIVRATVRLRADDRLLAWLKSKDEQLTRDLKSGGRPRTEGRPLVPFSRTSRSC